MHIKTSCPAFLLFILCSLSTLAQTNELIGRIALEDGNAISYKVVFTDSAGILTGYSVSDPGPNQTKAVIRGNINRDKKTFSFSETKVLNAKDKSVEYCLLKCSCKITEQKGIQLFKGKVSGYIGGNTAKPCGKGSVAFSTTSDILKLTQKLMAKVDTNKLDKEQKQLVDSFRRATINTSMDLVDAKKGVTFSWNADSMKIEVYDDGEIDYDRVSIMMNDAKILDNHTSTREKHQLTIPVPHGINILKFHAENEGNSPPNTTRFILWDGNLKHMISTNLYYGQDAVVEIER